MKKYQRFFFSGIVFPLLVASQSYADDAAVPAKKPGQSETQQQEKTEASSRMQPVEETNQNAPKAKFRIHSQDTGEAELRNFIGVVTEPIPAALAAQLNPMMKSGQGIGVKFVLPDSPAQKAGIKMFDVLTTYNDKAITSSDVLRKFVMESDKGSRVKFGVIRASKHQIIEVELTQKLFKFRKFSIVPVSPDQKDTDTPPENKSPQSPSQKEGQIASRSTETDPLGRKPPLGLSHIPVTTTSNLSLLYTGNLKDGYTVDINYQDTNDTLQTHQFKGEMKEIHNQVSDMPDHVQSMIKERLNDLQSALKGQPPFRFQIKGHMQGNVRFIRVFLSRGTKDNSIRMVELDHRLGNRPKLNVNQIMANQIFIQELKQLNPTIQEQIRATLQRIRIPTAQVRVDNPI